MCLKTAFSRHLLVDDIFNPPSKQFPTGLELLLTFAVLLQVQRAASRIADVFTAEEVAFSATLERGSKQLEEVGQSTII